MFDTVPRDSVRLTLSEQPTVQPALDSIILDTTDFPTTYRIYARMPDQDSTRLGVILQWDASDTTSRGIPSEKLKLSVDSTSYIISIDLSIIAADLVAVVGFNPIAGKYLDSRYHSSGLYRYCSEGPLSNFLPIPK
jgi:hypothetical protein